MQLCLLLFSKVAQEILPPKFVCYEVICSPLISIIKSSINFGNILRKARGVDLLGVSWKYGVSFHNPELIPYPEKLTKICYQNLLLGVIQSFS